MSKDNKLDSAAKPDCEIFPFAEIASSEETEDQYIKLTGVDLPKMKKMRNWEITDSGVYKLTYKAGKISSRLRVTDTPMLLTGKLVDLDSGSKKIFIEWADEEKEGGGMDWLKAPIPFKVTQTYQTFLDLSEDGVPIDGPNYNNLQIFMADSRKVKGLPIAYFANRCGWIKVNNETGFLVGKQYITKYGTVDASESTPATWDRSTVFMNTDSSDGSSQTINAYKQHGSEEAWKDIFESVLEFPAVLIGVYLSLACPALKLFPAAKNPVVEYSGASSRGKSTTLKLASSCWADPQSAGIIKTWKSTETGRERFWETNRYLPSFLDETQSVKEVERKDLIDAVYDYANGVGKARGTICGSQKTAIFKGVLFSTGESPITSFSQAEGGHARILNLKGSPFGKEPQKELTEGINKALANSYGHVGPKVVKWLIENEDQWASIQARFHDTARAYSKRGVGVLASRKSSVIPLIEVGMYLAKMVGLPDPKCDPLEFAFEATKSDSKVADLPANALNSIFTECTSQSSKFWKRNSNDDAYLIGVWEPKEDWENIGINPTVLDKWLKELGYSPVSIISSWIDRGWLIHNKDKVTRKMIMRGSRPRLICIKRCAIDEINKDD